MNAELQSRQEEIVEEFSFYENWMEKYEQLIEMGKELDALPEQSRLDEHLIRGCQSRVWLLASKDEGQAVRFHADSDAIITKGLVALMVRVLDGLPPKDIAESDLWFIEKNWIGQTPESYTRQWLAFHGDADEALRRCVSGKVKGLLGIGCKGRNRSGARLLHVVSSCRLSQNFRNWRHSSP